MLKFKLVLIVDFLSVCVVSVVASGERIGLSTISPCEAAIMKIFKHRRKSLVIINNEGYYYYFIIIIIIIVILFRSRMKRPRTLFVRLHHWVAGLLEVQNLSDVYKIYTDIIIVITGKEWGSIAQAVTLSPSPVGSRIRVSVTPYGFRGGRN